MTTLKPPTDRHAEAIAQVSSMRDTILAQKDMIATLEREVALEKDRVSLLTEERARWRTDALACRTFVVKLATILEHVNAATRGARSILDDMAQMDSGETPKAAVEEAAQFVEDNLTKLRGISGGTTLQTLSQGAPSNL